VSATTPARRREGDATECPEPGPLARKLRFLLDQVHPPDRGRYTYREVIAGIVEAGDPPLSLGYLGQLINGERTNPTLDALTSLAHFFGVPISYLTNDDHSHERDIEEQLRALSLLRDTGVRGVALRAHGLPQGQLDLVVALLDKARESEGLPPIADDGPSGAHHG
jgi:transcriptional regulator with XRE-family HTH domain